MLFFFFSSRRRHTRYWRDWSSDVCSSDLWVSGNVVMTIRRRLFRHMMLMPVSYFDQNPAGRLLSRVTYDTEMVANSSSNALVTIVREGVYLISLFAVMLYTSWQLSLILFALAPIIGGLIGVVSKRFRELSRNIQGAMGELTTSTEQMIKGHKVILSYGGYDVESQRFDSVSDDMRRKGLKIVAADGIDDGVVQLIASLALSAVWD